MKNLIFVVLIAVIAFAGYDFINKPAENEETIAVQAETTESAVEDTAATVISDENNLKTPADMSDEAQTEMYGFMMGYNKCMMKNRPEYHQVGSKVEEIASKTFDECAPILDGLKAVLAANDVNKGLQEGMAKTLQQRASRKLMTAIMQSQAAQMTADASAMPVMP
ncbi:MAG: hypothetical protein HRT92_04730 [Piscirickettsiaceae bacterium]|nr:hypothetical protein [Piscirickettsiaceae bacterium]